MDKRKWLRVVSSLNSIKMEGIITKEEYELYKSKLKLFFETNDNCGKSEEDYSSYDNCLSEEEIYDLIEKYFNDEYAAFEEIKKLKKIDLYHILNLYNWGDGFSLPAELLEHDECDLSLALNIFALADGYTFIEDCYLKEGAPSSYFKDWWDFCLKLFNDMGNGKFTSNNSDVGLPIYLVIILLKKGIVNDLTKKFQFLME